MLSLKDLRKKGISEFVGTELFDLNNISGGKELSSYTRSNGVVIAKDISDCTEGPVNNSWDNTKWITKEDRDWGDYWTP